MLQEVKTDPIPLEPLLRLLDHFALSQGHLWRQVVREQYLTLGGVKLLGHSFEQSVGVEEKSVPGCLVVQFVPHLLLFLLLERSLVFRRIPVQLTDLLLVRLLLLLRDDLPNVLKRRLHVDNPSKHHRVVEGTVSSQCFLWLRVVHKTIPLVPALVQDWQFDLGDASETGESAPEGGLGQSVGEVGDVEARTVDLERLGDEGFVALGELRGFDFGGFV